MGSKYPLGVLCLKELTHILNLHLLEVFVDMESNVENNILSEIYGNHGHGSLHEKIPQESVTRMKTLIQHLRKVPDTEGLFRVSGNKKRQEELKNVFSRSKGKQLEKELQTVKFNSHDAAGLLKQYLNELEEPLLTKDLYDCYQQVAGKIKEMEGCSAEKKKIEALQLLFLLLPPTSRIVLKELLDLLSLVAAHEDSKMTAFNLGLIFAPSIVCARKTMCCLNDYEVNVEPLTELVTFLIENATSVFQIPRDFLNEAEKYLRTIDADQTKDEVPMTKTFCEQIDAKEFTRQGQINTQEAITTLYAQVMEMPDSRKKTELLNKFQKSYAGTAIFVPKAIRERAGSLENGLDEEDNCTIKNSKQTDDIKRSFFRRSVRKALSEPVLTESRHINGSTPVKTSNSESFPEKESSHEHLKCQTPYKHGHNQTTPGSKVRQCFKRIRRRSVEMFKLKPSTPNTPSNVFQEDISSQSQSNVKSKFRSMFRRSQRYSTTSHQKSLKKSISTPAIASFSQDGLYTVTQHDRDLQRKLSFSEDKHLNVLDEKHIDTLADVFESTRISSTSSIGLVNPAFCDNPTIIESRNTLPNSTAYTPVIKKSLYPSNYSNNTHKQKSVKDKENESVALHTPVIKTRVKSMHMNGALPMRPIISDITNKSRNTLV